MTKFFCDRCNAEISTAVPINYEAHIDKPTGRHIAKFNIHVEYPHNCHVCKNCFRVELIKLANEEL